MKFARITVLSVATVTVAFSIPTIVDTQLPRQQLPPPDVSNVYPQSQLPQPDVQPALPQAQTVDPSNILVEAVAQQSVASLVSPLIGQQIQEPDTVSYIAQTVDSFTKYVVDYTQKRMKWTSWILNQDGSSSYNGSTVVSDGQQYDYKVDKETGTVFCVKSVAQEVSKWSATYNMTLPYQNTVADIFTFDNVPSQGVILLILDAFTGDLIGVNDTTTGVSQVITNYQVGALEKDLQIPSSIPCYAANVDVADQGSVDVAVSQKEQSQ